MMARENGVSREDLLETDMIVEWKRCVCKIWLVKTVLSYHYPHIKCTSVQFYCMLFAALLS